MTVCNGFHTITELVAAQATTAPSRLAVSDGELNLTYAALEARANRLARHLVGHRAGREQVVALVLPRSAELVIAALAALKAAAAYAPIDPSAPAERITATLEDADPCVVVTLRGLTSRLPRGRWPIVALDGDSDASAIERHEPGALAHQPAAGDLAYVIYTSGSTGRPKGVEVTHDNLLNLVRWHHEAFRVTAADRAPLMASPGFDASVWETWPYLAAGASLHLPDDVTRMDAEALRDWLIAQDITIAFVATPMAERMLMLPWPTGIRLRTLLTGADTLHHRPAEGLPFALVNNYGPTECTVVATSCIVDPDPHADSLPGIGDAIAGATALVLDADGRPVADGVEGELHVGGAGVARGYRNRPDLTAERFVTGPDGARLYRTGDRVRRLVGGGLAFLGRVDDQVKIRGYRVELDEIVAVLNSHPGVQASTVVARPGSDGTLRLIAYVVAANDAKLTPTALLTTLRSRLPDYMLPAVFVPIDDLPLMASGKVDRTRLPDPEQAETLRDPEFEAPTSPVERRLADIVAALLNVARVGVGDNFFLLGGHSLLGTQLIARLRDAFGVDLPLRTVFDHPTVTGLAGEVERAIVARLEEPCRS